VASELRRWIEEAKAVQRLAEEDVTKLTPSTFTAFAEASEEERVGFTVRSSNERIDLPAETLY
jgi:hypothetical protein